MRAARTPNEVDAAMALRRRVFCDEQGVALEAEQDGRDGEALHLVALAGGHVVGTCRLLIEGSTSRLGRMAVEPDWRGSGVGRVLLAEADRAVAAAGAPQIRLHAQSSARGVYERAGYSVRGRPFMEEGIEHVAMEKRVA